MALIYLTTVNNANTGIKREWKEENKRINKSPPKNPAGEDCGREMWDCMRSPVE